ncbi:MAG: GNAT family N-acetyltransferase [Faecalibacterium sp.]|nr:GNAT family N-acetyltransferase [Ruminococcus sp.]MCM1391595.1 GNAT family N-acetyltransferase [Ruminococcus sp.]MCM1486491.1 GNAT family N-acetyltransferase [Faecalibacterium sp.]
MIFKIDPMTADDFDEVLSMMREFYQSPAILHKASDEILKQDIKDCVSDNPYIEGYVFKDGGEIIGYSMLAKSYSTEFGGLCIWIEDLYIKPEYRHKGIGSDYFRFLDDKFKNTAVRMRLEVEPSNINAIKAYKKNGYNELPYIEMTK